MHSTQKHESGRALLETLAVLAIIGILSVSGMLGYNYLIQLKQKHDAANAVEQAVIALNTTDVLKHFNPGELVKLGEVSRGLDVKDDVMKLPTGEYDYMAITVFEGDQYAMNLQIQPDVCETFLKTFAKSNAVWFDVGGNAEQPIVGRAEFTSAANAYWKEKHIEDGVGLRLSPDMPKELYDQNYAKILERCQMTGRAGAVYNCATGSISFGYDYGVLCKGCKEDETWASGQCCKTTNLCGTSCGCPEGMTCDKSMASCVACTITGTEGNTQCKILWEGKGNDTWFQHHVCDGPNRNCVECLTDSDCTVEKPHNPYGDDEHGTPTHKFCVGQKCVACKVDADCPSDSPICETGVCKSCPPGKVYNPTTGTCLCSSGFEHPETKECVDCIDSSEGSAVDRGCVVAKPICVTEPEPHKNNGTNAVGKVCGVCIDDKTETKADGGCASDPKKPICLVEEEKNDASMTIGNQCVECVVDENCPGNWVCDSSNHTCVPCINDQKGDKPDRGCVDSNKPLCAAEPGMAGKECFHCINDKEDLNVDTGCTKDLQMCIAETNAYTNDKCETCPTDKPIWNVIKKHCTYCYDSAKRDGVDRGCEKQGKKHICGTNGKDSNPNDGTGSDGTQCFECLVNTDCPENTRCEKNECVPCNEQRTGVRGKDELLCHCPPGTTMRCGSTRTDRNCTPDNGGWICASGCFANTDCEADYCCSCVGAACGNNGGQCKKEEGKHRAKDSATMCLPCMNCEHWDANAMKCVSDCADNEICMQKGGDPSKSYKVCSGTKCLPVVDKSKLRTLKGSINKRTFYIPPSQAKYRLTHTSASRFCEHYGLHLATVVEACSKNYHVDTGHDCPNITSNQTFSSLGQTFKLSDWDVADRGSFWLADLNENGETALRVTYSCGNNHEDDVCNEYYPLCTN